MANIVAGNGLRGGLAQAKTQESEQDCDHTVVSDGISRLSSLDPDQDASSECVTNTLSCLTQKCLVVHEVAARYGNIEHLVIREDGAVFLIETKPHAGFITHEEGLLLVDGRPFESDFIRQTTTNAFVLRDLLADGLGISPFIHAAIVFPNACVGVEKAIYGVDVLEGEKLKPWMAKARGNQEIAGLVAVTWSPLV
jgi:hypothetical protein